MRAIALWTVLLLVSSCAHEPSFGPSQGHINGEQAPTQTTPAAGDIPKPAKSGAYLPPPKPKAKEQTYSVVVNDVPVREILFALARESKKNIDIHPGITGNVTLNAVDQTLPAILERISRQVDLRYKMEGNTLSITPDIPTLHTYKVDYVNMDRDTTSSIGVAAQISSTGGAASTTGTTSTSSSASNSSNTVVSSKSKNSFWDSLGENVRTILRSTKSKVALEQETNSLISSANQALAQSSTKSGEGAEAANVKQAQESREALLKLVKEQAAMVKDDVVVNALAGTVTVMATERQHEFIRRYLHTVEASVQRQVLIEATIVEVTLNDTYQLGIDWNVVAGNFSVATALGMTPVVNTATKTGNSFVATYTGGNDKAAIRALQTFGNTRVLSSPKLMALNNQTAILKVVDNLVYFTIEAEVAAGNASTNSLVAYTTTPHTIPVGVVMSMTPQISDSGGITLNVRPTISRKVGEVQDPNPSLNSPQLSKPIVSTIPEIEVREMESVLQLESGQAVVMGGLMQDEVAKNSEGVPVLSKLPLVGKLFQGKDTLARKTELVIFLRPTILKRPSLDTEELAKFKQYLPDELPAVTDHESVN